jgi:SAM-dependent methyltransferase
MSPADAAARDARTAFFDERAPGWEAACYPDGVRARLWPLVESFALPPGGRVLDMGTGPGTLLPYLRQALGQGGTITAFDISPGMAREAGRKRGETRAGVVCASAMAMPFRTGSFDAVVCFAAFPHFEDKPSAVREMARVARPGGRIVVAHLLGRARLSDHHGKHPAVARDLLPEDADMERLFREAGLTEFSLIDRDDLYRVQARKP